jgi:ankyrin repeat protein
LSHAAKNGREEVVLKLLEAGAEKSSRIEANGETALLLACRWGRVNAARLLLNAGANTDTRNKRGQGVFHLACENEHVNVVRLLRSKKCDASGQDCRGYTALMIASEKGNVSVLDNLLRCKTCYKSRDAVSDKGNTAMHLASRMGRAETVKTLIKANASVQIRNRFGNTPLTIACQHGHADAVRALLHGGAQSRRKITIGGIHERTAVTVAASHGQKEVLRVLLSENIKADKKPSTEVPYYLLPEKKPWNKQEPWKDGNRIAW